MKCDRCDDTGSLSKDMHGYLDCPFCDVSDERASLGLWLSENHPTCDDCVTAWAIYQHGKTAALNT